MKDNALFFCAREAVSATLQNFERLGLKKLISTSYAPESKTAKYGVLFEYAAMRNGETPKNERGKIFVLDHDVNKNGRIDFDDLEWEEAKAAGVSNCPLCAVGHDANAKRIYDFKEMEADHVTAWSKGGDTSKANCQMLCKTHNRAKGNA